MKIQSGKSRNSSSARVLGLLLSVLVLLCTHVPSLAADALYGQRIVIPADAGKELKAAADDSAQTLQKMTGAAFTITNEYSGSGVFLLRGDSAQATTEDKKWLADKGNEPFAIRSGDGKNLWVIANDDKGLIHGLYFYLEQLGVRFYFPNDNWTIIPKRNDIALKINRQMTPEFEIRNFFGTGAFGAPNTIDPKLEIRDRWEQWKTRNGMGGEFKLGGHSGEAFNVAKKAILLEHPEYLAKVDGKYVPWSLGAKLNTANADVVRLYVDWTVERLQQMFKRDPQLKPQNAYVSAEPSDGGGQCNSDECKQIGNGSASDQVFYVTNLAAKAVAKEFPGAHVNVYAYNEHAAPPSFPLEPNVYVEIIPYAFQRTGLTPTELIKAWGRKVSRMGIYDYWSVPDGTHDEPDFNYLSTPIEKLKLWKANNISAFNGESTNSAGAMGIGWYLASRLMWDLKTDQNAVLNDFYDKAFGAARPPMQRMLERWANSFKLTGYELAASYRDLQEALQLAKTPEVRARLADYGRYLEYLRLRLEWQDAPAAGKSSTLAALVDYVWDIYPSAMIHSFREYQLLVRGNTELQAEYAKGGAGWNDVSMPSDEAIFKAIDAGVKQHQPLDFTPRRFHGELVPLPNAPATPADFPTPSLFTVGSTTLELVARPGQSTLLLKINGVVRVQLKDAAGKILYDQEVKPNGDWNDWKVIRNPENLQQLSIPLPAAGRYQLVLRVAKNGNTHLQLPRGFLLTMQNFLTGKPMRSPRLYFYVPKGLKNLALYMPSSLPKIMENRFYDSQGNKVQPTTYDDQRVYLVPIPAGEDGKVWSMDNVVSPNYTPEMLNAPQAFALYPDALLLPNDAIKE